MLFRIIFLIKKLLHCLIPFHMNVYIDTASSRGRGWGFYLQDVTGGGGANGTIFALKSS